MLGAYVRTKVCKCDGWVSASVNCSRSASSSCNCSSPLFSVSPVPVGFLEARSARSPSRWKWRRRRWQKSLKSLERGASYLWLSWNISVICKYLLCVNMFAWKKTKAASFWIKAHSLLLLMCLTKLKIGMSDPPTLEEHCLSTWRLCPALKDITIFISTRPSALGMSDPIWGH